MLFDANRATKAALTFFRNTKAGQMVTIPLGSMKGMWERGQESEERERRKRGAFRVGGGKRGGGPPRLYVASSFHSAGALFIFPFLYPLCFVLFFKKKEVDGEKGGGGSALTPWH